ncbi:DUF1573 domain-containing protein, partial [bacterium]|nr:DUF1573 domain-containing protein [bacterium]
KEGEIKVTFNTAHRKGKQAKRITVRSNDPNNPVTTLTIKGTVKVEVEVIPESIYFGQIKKNQGLERKITILPSTQKDFKVESITSSNEFITTKLEDYLEGDKKGYKLTVELSKKFKPGRVSEHVMIKTNNQKMPQINVQVSGSILGDISVTPSSLAFISSSVGIRNVRRVNLVNSGEIPLKVEEVKLDIPELTYEVKTIKEGEQIEINVTFKPTEGTKPRLSTKLYIKTNIPDQKEIEIPIFTSLRESEYIPETIKQNEKKGSK